MDKKTREIQNQIINDFNKCFGKRLQNLRELNKYSMEDFAKKLCISVNELEKYESGKGHISFILLLLITEILNISLNDFFGKNSGLNNSEVETNVLQVLFSLKTENKI